MKLGDVEFADRRVPHPPDGSAVHRKGRAELVAGGDSCSAARLLPRPHTPRMRLLALIGLGRIEVLALHGAKRTRHIAITKVHDALREAGDLLEEPR